MAFPVDAPLLDSFNRANEAPIAGPWALPRIQGGGNNNLQVVSNSLAPTTGGNGYLTTTYGPDVGMHLTVGTPPPNGSYVGLFLRGQGFGTADWEAYYLIWIKGTPNDTWNVRKKVAGVITNPIGNNASIATVVSGDKIGFSVVGSTLTTHKYSGGSWATVRTLTDTDLTLAGGVGIEADGATARYEDLSGGTIGGAEPEDPTDILHSVDILIGNDLLSSTDIL